MSERTALGATMETMTLEEPGVEESSPRVPGPLRCGPCAMWPRQQTWLCAVPLLMGFVGLGLSLMLLKWIVVGSVQDYVPTDLVNAKGIGQDPIFLSKPSVPPKGPDATTTSTTSPGNTNGPIPGSAADGTSTVLRTQSGTSSNHSSNSSGARGAGAVEGGSGNRAPHLHNRVGTRGNGTAIPGEKEVTPRSTTVRKPSPGGSRNVYPSSRAVPPSPISITTTTTATTTTSTAKSTATTQVPPLITTSTRPTQRLNHGRASKGPSTKPTRPHHRFRTLAPTTPTVRSEFFKPCQDSQELAFCLNEGECFIIETVAGVHRHCRCKEGYRGLRCDQFVPKTDPILSNPTADELGIEFMESGETYQKQILSIFSIAMGISLLGLACMALYCRNKRQRGKPRAHQTEIRTLRDCSIIASRLMSKSSPRIDYDLQHQKCCKAHGSSPTPGHCIGSNDSKVSSPNQSSSLAMAKSCSPAAKQKISNHQPVSRWTPPISRAGNYLTGGSKDSIHSYKHLREVESTDATLESLRRCRSQTEGNQYNHSFLNMQTEAFANSRERLTLGDVPCTRLDQGTAFPPPSHRACSVPIIPSVQASNPEDRAEDRSTKVLRYKDGAFASQTINSETEIGSLSNCSQGSQALGNQTKHKSLVTYTTALGPRTESTMAKTVISITVLGSGKERVHHSSSSSKSTGRPEHQHVQSTHELKKEQGAALYNSLIRRERDCHLSTEPKGLSSLTASKS
ncbi:pro-neuregulin-3, membrane-bound isoform isoform X1 [Pangasianodon hypophthalmus]|uniref:pro-neuregulin-3, membrane-bound isoform isoform X1 n=1 Tax=Pangasianodon hypophthalmus TaxID=310915 RepID=UPI000EFF211A|nr:pro-neuregulin-3, membrane-bound isoform isoform X1 [Pangasianodon hypophthalmus]